MGDYINFGYQVCVKGYVVAAFLYGTIFSCVYWYVFKY